MCKNAFIYKVHAFKTHTHTQNQRRRGEKSKSKIANADTGSLPLRDRNLRGLMSDKHLTCHHRFVGKTVEEEVMR